MSANNAESASCMEYFLTSTITSGPNVGKYSIHEAFLEMPTQVGFKVRKHNLTNGAWTFTSTHGDLGTCRVAD